MAESMDTPCSPDSTFTPATGGPYAVQESSLIIAKQPPIVGGYQMGGPLGISFNICERPHWIHRLGVRLVLGWVWEDVD